jgi:hypothetical protein
MDYDIETEPRFEVGAEVVVAGGCEIGSVVESEFEIDQWRHCVRIGRSATWLYESDLMKPEDAICENCGYSLLSGEHNIRVDADWYVCR